ncbi:MAG: glucoamylase family protein [Planctomycetota bacterium]
MRRRDFLQHGAAGSVALAASSGWMGHVLADPSESRWLDGASIPIQSGDIVSYSGTTSTATRRDVDQFLQEMRRRNFQYFLDAADPVTGLIADRGRADGSFFSDAASTAACGFGLAALSVSDDESLISRDEAHDRVVRMLDSLLHLAQHYSGFVYHFIDRRTGVRAYRSEASTIDTALMLAGAMTAEMSFPGSSRVTELCQRLCERVQWRRMLSSSGVLHMGWKPGTGLLPQRWDRYSELTLMVLIAIGSQPNGIDPDCWHAWRRSDELTHRGEAFLSYPPLFVHQYPMAFFDFRGWRSPSGRDYWRNSVTAHAAQIDFMRALADRYPDRFSHYGSELWGLTSSDSVSGYRDWGGPYQDGRIEPDRGIDGTVVPSAAAGALAITGDAAVETLLHQRDRYGDLVYGEYGFANAFNPATGWVSPDVIGIDTGISYLMSENRRAESIWNAFMRHPTAERAFQRVGFYRS